MITAIVLARRSGVSLYAIRHYTRIGLLKPECHPHNNYKIYQPSDEIRLRFICAAKEFGFSLSETAEILNESKKGKSSCPLVKEIILRHIEANRRRIKQMKKTQKQMETALGEWDLMKNAVPDGGAVRRLIESVAEVTETGVGL